ncbi:hypothetical protein [Moraxella catarrhalis]|uniref:hypothetical protein n=1 Tax=Moraxella catarrhalis TaxID=480 RepID=UPI0007E4D964|nr:hypothetical protein [Moraxella catarrhalis]OAV12953.1 hypothetical protein AO375_1675 [Moraxella catarrhalis]OAV36560.1 hypothetical protein AO365_0955 [Moraxella catarrhalis]
MKLLIRIVQVVATAVSMTVIVFYFYKLYNPDTSKRDANPYLYERKYYSLPTEEELTQLMDELTNYDQNYDHNFYIKKAKFSPSSLTRGWSQTDKTEEIKKQINKRQFILLKTDKGDVYCKGEIMIEFGMDLNIRTQKRWFFISVSWRPDNECRKYWWGGKNPRALRDNHQPVR